MAVDFLVSEIRASDHRGGDDLLSAGLGLAGLAGLPVLFADPRNPTPAELRRRAIQMSWKGIADLGPLGGYGSVYGTVADVPGREFTAFARLPGARAPHRVLLQAPDAFDARARCLVVAASSGSRGIYGAIALAGAFGLPRGCAVACTDKGTGSGYFDTADGSGVALDGRRARRGEAMLEFEPETTAMDAGIAIKHLHSGDNPESDWGRHVLQAARFGLAMLDRAYPQLAPFTPENTHILVTGLSNGGGAALQAAGMDADNIVDGVVALEPNVHVRGRGRALYDYATEAAIWMPCALADPAFDAVPLARAGGAVPPWWLLRGAQLQARGWLDPGLPTTLPSRALDYLRERGWRDSVLATAASSVTFDVWRSLAAGYASAYLRRGVGDMPGGFAYVANAATVAAGEAARALWWTDASGIPPGAGVDLTGGLDAGPDPALPGLIGLRELWQGDGTDADLLRESVATLTVGLPRDNLPVWVVHGADDGLIPAAFTSAPYVAWLREQGRRPRHWEVPHAQHFDAFLALPGFGERYVPLLAYGYAALERLWSHVVDGEALADPVVPSSRPRGTGPLQRSDLGLG